MAKKSTAPAAAPKAANLPAKKEVSSSSVPAEFLSGMAGMGTGFENVTAKDLLIPRLTILQALSPQVIRTKPEYDPEAKVGDIYDVALAQRFPDKVHILPIHFVTQWLEWAPRNTGKGLVRIHDVCPSADYYTNDDRGRMISKKGGNLIQETAQLYILNLSANARPSFIPFASTQLKKSRKLMTWATNEKIIVNGVEQTPPLFYRTYKCTSVPENNSEGDWMGWKIEPDVPVTELSEWSTRFNAVREFRKSVLAGEVKADLSQDDVIEGNASSGSDDGRAM